MDEQELATAEPATLRRMITELTAALAQATAMVARLEARVAELEARPPGSGRTMPGTKPPQRSKASGQPRKRRDRGAARVRLTPTAIARHAADQCPDCGTALAGGWVQRRREVIELPATPVVVTEHQIVVRTCPVCRTSVQPSDPLAGIAVAKQRFGPRLQSVIATLREAACVPVRTIQRLVRDLFAVHVSLGAITLVSDRLAARGEGEVAALRDQVRASPVVHLDETGWRQTGVNGYVWSASAPGSDAAPGGVATPPAVVFIRRSRRKEVVDELLGDAFAGVLCSDFYAAYDHYPGRKQRCWVHLLRDIHDLTQQYPDDAGLTAWAAQVRAVYDAAQAFADPDPRRRIQAQLHFERQVGAVCAPFVDAPDVAQRRLCRRVQRYLNELFVFVAEPAVPADNNAAERCIRPLVTRRKIAGGTRSDQGSTTLMTLASLVASWRLQNRNPLQQFLRLLTTPQPSPQV